MRNHQKIILLTVLVLTMFVMANNLRQRFTLQSPVDTDNIIFANDYLLSGKHDGALVIVANTVDGGEAGTIEGDAALIGREDVTFHGNTAGDLTVMGENIDLSSDVSGSTAVMGDIIVLNGRFSGPVTVIGKFLTVGADSTFPSLTACVNDLNDNRIGANKQRQAISPCQDKAAALATFAPFQALRGDFGSGSAGSLLFSLMSSLLLTGLSALAVTIFPRQFSHIQEAITSIPRGLAGVGCMTGLLAVGIAAAIGLLLAVVPPLAVILVPLGFLFALLLLCLSVVGWITLALLLGNTLVLRFKGKPQPPLVAAALGSLVLFAVWHLLALLPFGWMIALLGIAAFGSMGLGGTVATRIGTRPLRRQYFVQG
jgi:hypothetical protein